MSRAHDRQGRLVGFNFHNHFIHCDGITFLLEQPESNIQLRNKNYDTNSCVPKNSPYGTLVTRAIFLGLCISLVAEAAVGRS